MLFADGFDDAVIGVVERVGQPHLVCYDIEKMVEILVSQGASDEDAREYIHFNVVCAWVGAETPAYLWRKTAEEIREMFQE